MSGPRRAKPATRLSAPRPGVNMLAQFMPDPARSGVNIIIAALALFRSGVVADEDDPLFPLQQAYRAYVREHRHGR